MKGVSSTNRKKMSPALKYRMKVLENQCKQNQAELRLQAEQALEIVTVLQETYTGLLHNKMLNEITAAKQAEYDRVLCLLIAKIREHHATVRPILFKRIVTNGDVVHLPTNPALSCETCNSECTLVRSSVCVIA